MISLYIAIMCHNFYDDKGKVAIMIFVVLLIIIMIFANQNHYYDDLAGNLAECQAMINTAGPPTSLHRR